MYKEANPKVREHVFQKHLDRASLHNVGAFVTEEHLQLQSETKVTRNKETVTNGWLAITWKTGSSKHEGSQTNEAKEKARDGHARWNDHADLHLACGESVPILHIL